MFDQLPSARYASLAEEQATLTIDRFRELCTARLIDAAGITPNPEKAGGLRNANEVQNFPPSRSFSLVLWVIEISFQADLVGAPGVREDGVLGKLTVKELLLLQRDCVDESHGVPDDLESVSERGEEFGQL